MTTTLPIGLYLNDVLYEGERRAVFGQEWMILGRTDELSGVGGYVAEEIAGYPVFVVLDADGLPWGYHNVCPHRAGPILMPGRGCTEALTCQYHGWRFSFEGALIEAPGFDGVVEVGPGIQRLSDISMGRWANLLWISLSGIADPLSEELDVLMADCADIDFDQLTFTGHETRIMKCNWKLIVENYLEGYHVAGTHKILESFFDMGASIVEILDDSTTVQRARTQVGAPIRWYYRYPNVMIQVLESTVCWTQVLPRGPHETMLVMDFFTAPGATDAPLRRLCHQLIDEDRALCERVHANLAAGVFQGGHLSPTRENAVGWFRGRILTSTDVRSDVES